MIRSAHRSGVWSSVLISVFYLTLWAVIWPYRGLEHDSQLYAIQAINRLRPGLLSSDLYFRFGSQDDFTIFSWLVSQFLKFFSVEHAAALIAFLCFILFTSGAWLVARRLSSARLAWLAIGLLTVLPGYYGAFSVFRLAESFLTARTLGEAMVLLAIASFVSGRQKLAVVICLAAHFIHPLMAFPGLLLLILMSVPPRWMWPMVIGSAAVTIAGLLVIDLLPALSGLLVDGSWLSAIKQRSIFLFLDHWRVKDWNRIAVAFATLVLAAKLSEKAAARRLAIAALILGFAGIALTAATTFWLPVKLLLMGQPWRWLWIPTVLAILLLPAVIEYLNTTHGRKGWSAIILLCSCWIGVDIAGLALAAGVLLSIYLIRAGKTPVLLGVAAVTAGCLVMIWSIASAVEVGLNPIGLGREPLLLERTRDVLGLSYTSIPLVIFAWFVSKKRPSRALFLVMIGITLLAGWQFGPRAVSDWRYEEYDATKYKEFEPWRKIIPPNVEVLWLDQPVAVWLLLERPSYVSRSQSSGIVFSHRTADLVVSRANRLAPLADVDWMLGEREATRETIRALTPEILREICRDPELGYVVGELSGSLHPGTLTWTKPAGSISLHDCRSLRDSSQPSS